MMAGVPRRVLVVLGAAVLAAGTGPSAFAHVVAIPAFLPSQSSRSIDLAGLNERVDPMTGFSVEAPSGLVIEHAHKVEGWSATYDDSTATWTGGSLTPAAEQTFGVTLAAETGPGILELTVEQLYADGAIVSWPVAITVTPADASPSQNLALAGVIGLIGLLLVVAVAMLVWRRRASRHGAG